MAFGLIALPVALVVVCPGVSARFSRRFIRIFFRLFVFLNEATGMFRIEVKGLDPGSVRGRIVVVNHLALIDTLIVMALLPLSTTLAKAARKSNPFLGLPIRRAYIPSDAELEKVVARAKEALAAGENVLIFPQGTRGGEKVHRGAARIALECAADIECFRISYDPQVLAKKQPWWDVADRLIMIQFTHTGSLPVSGEPNHRNAVRLTEQIKEKIL